MCKKSFFYRRRYANRNANAGNVEASNIDKTNSLILITLVPFCSFSVVEVDTDLFVSAVAVVSVLVR